eukprot:3321005-Rhodomonas_salina.2
MLGEYWGFGRAGCRRVGQFRPSAMSVPDAVQWVPPYPPGIGPLLPGSRIPYVRTWYRIERRGGVAR